MLNSTDEPNPPLDPDDRAMTAHEGTTVSRLVVCIHRQVALLIVGAGCMVGVPAAAEQGMPASPVRYTEAREHMMRRSIRLPGTVESASMSLVASEVAGLVMELPAREGTTVNQGEVLAKLRSTNLELRLRATESELREAEARQQLAEREWERARDLYEDELYSQQQLDAAEFEFTARVGKVGQLNADMERLKDDFERSTIRAPFTGVVVAEHTEVGQWLTIGGPVVELHALHRLEVVVEVPERYFSAIRRGASTTVIVESLDVLEVEGRVNAIIPRGNTQARTFPVKVRIPNPDGVIGVGMLTQVAFPIGDTYQATVVPKDALILRGAQRLVYIIGDGGTAEILPVEVGAGVGEWVAVDHVTVGAKVITRGNERLRPGQAVAGELLEYALP